MVTTKLNLSMTEPQVRQSYAKQGDTGRVLDIALDQTPEDGTLRILRPDGVEVTSEAVTGGEVESGGTFESLTEADVTELTVGIEPVQDLSHGDPSPSNICPITGHDEARVFFGAEQGTADETYTTSLGQTVYGGTLDMVSGVLTVDKAIVTAPTRGSLDSSGKLYRLNGISGQREWLSAVQPTEYGITNQFSAQSLADARVTGEKCFVQYGDGFYIGGFVGDTATLDTLLTTLQVVYKLANPVTYQLTAQQIKTLVGTNNVWASSGDIVNITFTYGGLFSKLPSEATSVVGKCYCDVEQNGVSSMPFTLNVKKNERES